MGKIKREDILNMTVEDLREKIKSDKINLRKMKFNHTISPLDNPNVIRNMKKEIARLMTDLRRREKEQLSNS